MQVIKIFKVADNVSRQSETFTSTMSECFIIFYLVEFQKRGAPHIHTILNDTAESVRVPRVTVDPFKYKILKTV